MKQDVKANPRVEKRRAFIINFTYFSILVGLFYLFMKYAFWPAFPFLMALFFAMICQRPVNFITRKTPLKRGVVSLLMVLLILAIIGGLLTLIGANVVAQLRSFGDYLQTRFDTLPQMIEEFKTYVVSILGFLPDSIEHAVTNAVGNFFDNLAGGTGGAIDWSFLSGPLKVTFDAAKQIPSIVLAIVVSIVCCVFMTIDFPRIRNFIYRQIPTEKRRVFSTSKKAVTSSFGKIGKAYLLIICITFLELLIGFKILNVMGALNGNYIIILALIIAIIDILPVLGTGTVLMPWALYSLIVGNTKLGIGLLVIYAFITILRQYIEPKLVSQQLGLPPFLTLIAMFFGIKLFGFIGLFLMPMLVMLLKLLSDRGLIHLWRTEADEKKSQAALDAQSSPEADANAQASAQTPVSVGTPQTPSSPQDDPGQDTPAS